MSISYNPFNKELQEIDQAHLQKLIDNKIAEGWFIEYKSRIPSDNMALAKSISSFANTKGGWIFWGIESDKTNFATKLTGVDISEYNNFQDRISQIIASNVDPKPIYHFKEVLLENELIVFIILVESGPMPPYITSQGIIYQRENNESKPIRDRYIIERLNDRARDYIHAIENFCCFDLGETKGQSNANQSYLELYMFPKPYDSFRFKKFHDSNFFKQIAHFFYDGVDFKFSQKETDVVSLGLKFNSIYSTGYSLITRALTEQNIIYRGTTAELFKNGNLKFTIPVNSFCIDDAPSHFHESAVLDYLLDSYSPLETFEQINHIRIGKLPNYETVTQRKATDFTRHIQFIDGVDLIIIITIIMEKYKVIMEFFGFDLSEEIGLRAKVTNTWRKFLFFDNDDYLEKIKLYNLPVTPKKNIEMPEFRNGKSFTFKLNEKMMSVLAAQIIIEQIGIPDSSTFKYGEVFENGLRRFKKDFS